MYVVQILSSWKFSYRCIYTLKQKDRVYEEIAASVINSSYTDFRNIHLFKCNIPYYSTFPYRVVLSLREYKRLAINSTYVKHGCCAHFAK